MESANCVALALREQGFAVTTMDVRGREEGMHYMLVLSLKRKLLKEALHTINSACDKAVITVSDVKVQKGGYMRNAATGRQVGQKIQ